jgi:SPX domain protein involved in polyphosphate accumulation
MVKFGKKFRETKIKEWEDNYIDYKSLKHFIKVNNDPSKLKLNQYYF